MSLDKAVEHSKERRRPYRGGKAVDKTCRNHGGCDWCLSNRTYTYRKSIDSADSKYKDYINGEDVEEEYE